MSESNELGDENQQQEQEQEQEQEQQHADGSGDEFDFYFQFTKPLVLELPTPEDRAIAAAWVQKLEAEPQTEEEKKRRLDYLKLLLFVLQRGHLSGIFKKQPAPGPLQSFPQGFTMSDMGNLMIDQDELQGCGGGDARSVPYTIEISNDLREFVAAQEVPNFGVQMYYAWSSDEPVHKWSLFDEEKFPTYVLEKIKQLKETKSDEKASLGAKTYNAKKGCDVPLVEKSSKTKVKSPQEIEKAQGRSFQTYVGLVGRTGNCFKDKCDDDLEKYCRPEQKQTRCPRKSPSPTRRTPLSQNACGGEANARTPEDEFDNFLSGLGGPAPKQPPCRCPPPFHNLECEVQGKSMQPVEEQRSVRMCPSKGRNENLNAPSWNAQAQGPECGRRLNVSQNPGCPGDPSQMFSASQGSRQATSARASSTHRNNDCPPSDNAGKYLDPSDVCICPSPPCVCPCPHVPAQEMSRRTWLPEAQASGRASRERPRSAQKYKQPNNSNTESRRGISPPEIIHCYDSQFQEPSPMIQQPSRSPNEWCTSAVEADDGDERRKRYAGKMLRVQRAGGENDVDNDRCSPNQYLAPQAFPATRQQPSCHAPTPYPQSPGSQTPCKRDVKPDVGGSRRDGRQPTENIGSTCPQTAASNYSCPRPGPSNYSSPQPGPSNYPTPQPGPSNYHCPQSNASNYSSARAGPSNYPPQTGPSVFVCPASNSSGYSAPQTGHPNYTPQAGPSNFPCPQAHSSRAGPSNYPSFPQPHTISYASAQAGSSLFPSQLEYSHLSCSQARPHQPEPGHLGGTSNYPQSEPGAQARVSNFQPLKAADSSLHNQKQRTNFNVANRSGNQCPQSFAQFNEEFPNQGMGAGGPEMNIGGCTGKQKIDSVKKPQCQSSVSPPKNQCGRSLAVNEGQGCLTTMTSGPRQTKQNTEPHREKFEQPKNRRPNPNEAGTSSKSPVCQRQQRMGNEGGMPDGMMGAAGMAGSCNEQKSPRSSPAPCTTHDSDAFQTLQPAVIFPPYSYRAPQAYSPATIEFCRGQSNPRIPPAQPTQAQVNRTFTINPENRRQNIRPEDMPCPDQEQEEECLSASESVEEGPLESSSSVECVAEPEPAERERSLPEGWIYPVETRHPQVYEQEAPREYYAAFGQGKAKRNFLTSTPKKPPKGGRSLLTKYPESDRFEISEIPQEGGMGYPLPSPRENQCAPRAQASEVEFFHVYGGGTYGSINQEPENQRPMNAGNKETRRPLFTTLQEDPTIEQRPQYQKWANRPC